MRRPLIAGNWKMHKNTAEALALVEQLLYRLRDKHRVEVVVCPPATSLEAVCQLVSTATLYVGAQNTHWASEGAFTGEISPRVAREMGCKFTIVGHSERRQYFGETDAYVHQRTRAALETGLTPIVCIGETLAQREAGETVEVIRRQVTTALENLIAPQGGGLVIAYEPVWAIGTGRAATAADAQEVAAFIRQLIAELFNASTAAKVRILYGGSVKPDNIGGFMAKPDIDGALVGGASLSADSFAGIVARAGRYQG
ncbi:MAG: triose-phosphate isomerase [Bacillota bacterium]